MEDGSIQYWKNNAGSMPALMDYVIEFLSSDDEDKRFTAGTALGDIVQLGERVCHVWFLY